MPTEVLVALITAASLAVGFFLRPAGEFLGEALRGRREKGERRDKYQFDTLTALQEELEVLLLQGRSFVPMRIDQAEARVESLTFMVRDDVLRERLELLASKARDSPEWRASYGDVVRRLGEVLRSM